MTISFHLIPYRYPLIPWCAVQTIAETKTHVEKKAALTFEEMAAERDEVRQCRRTVSCHCSQEARAAVTLLQQCLHAGLNWS